MSSFRLHEASPIQNSFNLYMDGRRFTQNSYKNNKHSECLSLITKLDLLHVIKTADELQIKNVPEPPCIEHIKV
jgi:hypothetical protein